MKTAIVYYSMAGNTAWTAKKLAEGLDADLIEIRPVKAYPDKGIRSSLMERIRRRTISSLQYLISRIKICTAHRGS